MMFGAFCPRTNNKTKYCFFSRILRSMLHWTDSESPSTNGDSYILLVLQTFCTDMLEKMHVLASLNPLDRCNLHNIGLFWNKRCNIWSPIPQRIFFQYFTFTCVPSDRSMMLQLGASSSPFQQLDLYLFWATIRPFHILRYMATFHLTILLGASSLV